MAKLRGGKEPDLFKGEKEDGGKERMSEFTEDSKCRLTKVPVSKAG